MVRAGASALGTRAMYSDLGIELNIDLCTDASGAKGIAQRRGLGKLRHAEVHILWLQQHVVRNVFRIHKIDGKKNPADLLMKYLDQASMQALMRRYRYIVQTGRAAACPQVSCGQ